MRVVGYHHSNPRILYRTSADVPVYDAKMTLELEDVRGHIMWSANLKPRFWGSQYISANLTKQAAREDHGSSQGNGKTRYTISVQNILRKVL